MSSGETGKPSASDEEKARIVRALYDVADKLVERRESADFDSTGDPALSAAFEELIREARRIDRPGFAEKVEAAARYLSEAVSASEQERNDETNV